MNLWYVNMCAVFMVSTLFTIMLLPKILLIAFRKKLFDELDNRKIHSGIVPRLGGLAFKPAICFSIAFIIGINLLIGRSELLEGLRKNEMELTFGFCSLMILYLIGIADDLIGVRYRTKFAFQILCGLMMVTSGLWINNLYGIMGIYMLPAFIGYPLTILIVVFIINAINLIDGIDGLASGISGIALCYYGVIFLSQNQYIYALLAFATLGTLIPFFYYNVFGNAKRGRKIFMGDTGSLTIGIILSLLSVKFCYYTPLESKHPQSIILAFSPLIIPCFDVISVMIHRMRIGEHLFKPDKNHIHHKFLDIGMSQRKTMIILLLTSVAFTSSNIFLSSISDINCLFVGNMALYAILNVWLTNKVKQKQLHFNIKKNNHNNK